MVTPLFAQQVNTDFIPASPGLNIGHSNQRWNGWFIHLHCVDINGVLCPPEFSPGNLLPINPGTPYQVIRYDPTGNNIQDSTGSDNPANGPTKWPSGLNVVGDAGYLQKTIGSGGVLANQLVDYDSSGNAIVSAVSSVAVHGVAHFTAIAGASDPIAVWGSHNVIVDNQTIINDHACPSSTVPGSATDTGSSSVPIACDDLGVFTSVNTGAGTLAVLELPSPVSLSGGISKVATCGTANSNAFYASIGALVQCDASATDDGVGHMTMKGLGLTDTTYAGFAYWVQGPAPPPAPTNSVLEASPIAVTTQTVIKPGGTATAGQAQVVDTIDTDTGGNPRYHMKWGTVASAGTEVQVNGVDTTAQTPINIRNTATITCTNPSAGNIDCSASTAVTHASDPVAPTVAQGGSGGATSDTYGIVGCEDTACTAHSIISSTGSTATANATLTTSNYNLLTAYADTLYGYRFYIVCRLTAGGTPSTTGVIATGVGKAFKDTGLAGDGSNCASLYAANTTSLSPVCLGSSLPGGNSVPGAPCGVDAPPLTVLAQSDEMGAQFGAPGDVNDGVWSWRNQGSCVASWSGGAIVIDCPSNGGGNNWRMLCRSLPTAPYTFVLSGYGDFTASPGFTDFGYGLYESSTNKYENLVDDIGDNSAILFRTHTTFSGFSNIVTGAAFSFPPYNGFYEKIVNDATNLKYYTSTNGINYQLQRSETITNFFTTTPDQACLMVNAHSGETTLTTDYARRTQ